MNTKLMAMTVAVAAISFTSCSKEDNTMPELQNGELRLSSGVATQTRSAFTMDTQIANGETVSVYVDKATTPAAPIYGNITHTADGNGALSPATTMYFPEDKSNVDIYAFHAGTLSGTDFPATIVHSVSANQTAAAGYAASDLLYSATKAVSFTKSAVALTFYHMLTKVEVALKVGTGTPNLTNAVVSIVGTQLKADFIPDKTATITDQSARAAMIVLSSAPNDAAPITIDNAVSTDFTSPVYNEAVIVPQTVAKDAQFIKVTLATGGDLYYKLPTATTFESGKKYSYHITVNLTGLTVTSTITNWVAIGPVSGNAEM